MKKPLVYLAIPYSHEYSAVRQYRFEMANYIAGQLTKGGLIVFSPISHCHPIAMATPNMPTSFELWEKYDRAFLECSHKLIVAMLDGWQDSKGVTAEIRIAQELGIEIEYLEVNQND